MSAFLTLPSFYMVNSMEIFNLEPCAFSIPSRGVSLCYEQVKYRQKQFCADILIKSTSITLILTYNQYFEPLNIQLEWH